MILHFNYCFQAIVSYWGEALQGKTWLPMKISIYLSIYLAAFFACSGFFGAPKKPAAAKKTPKKRKLPLS
jgi:hypothetical protein